MYSDLSAEARRRAIGSSARRPPFDVRPLRLQLRRIASLRLWLTLVSFACLLGLNPAFAQINRTWSGIANADWFNAANWLPEGVPATNDIINFGSGAISLTAPVTIYGQFNWSGGMLSGNSLTVASNGFLSLTGSDNKDLANVLTNAGTVTWRGSGTLRELNDNGSFKGGIYNLAGGLFEIQNDSTLSQFGAFGFFNNAGTLRKSSGAGATAIFVTLTNSGTVAVLQGTLYFYFGGTIEGTFSAAEGTAINFGDRSFTYGPLPTLKGPGAIQLNGGSLTLLDDVIPNLALVGGNLSLGPNFQGGTITNLTLGGVTVNGDHTVSGTFNWAGATVSGSLLVGAGATVNWSRGTANGPLTVASNGFLSLTGSDNKDLANVLTNAGTVTWRGSGTLRELNDNGSFKGGIYNLAGGLFEIQNDSTLSQFGAFGFFNNAGTLRKSSGAGATAIFVTLTNSGSVSVPQGTLALYGGFTPAGGTLEFGLSGLASFGKISISGNATLGGMMRAVWLGGFVPALGNAFDVITYGSRSGVFSSLDLPPAALWEAIYSSDAFTLTVTNISKLVVTSGPSGTNAGTILAPPITVQILDLNNNPATTSGVPVTLALGTGTGTLSGTLTQLTDATGKATFGDLSINLAGDKTLLATAPVSGLTPGTSASFTITSSEATQLAFVTPIHSPQPAGAAFSPAPVVRVTDSFGNTVSNSTAPITASLSSSGGGSLTGTLSGNANGAAGSATFNDLRFNLADPATAESTVIYFSSPGLTSVTNSAVMIDLEFSVITLSNLNSVIRIDPTTERGLFSWSVDGIDQAYQHWFWLRVDSATAQTSFDRLGPPLGLEWLSSNVVLYYFPPGMKVKLGFSLSGGAPGSQASALAETITVENLTNTAITLHLFEYSDFDLAADPYSDAISLLSAQTFLQQGKGMQIMETVESPTPNHWEAGFYGITMAGLLDPLPLTLSDAFIPQAPGDQTYAWQWDSALGVGDTFVINLTKRIEPRQIQLRIILSGPDVMFSWPTNGATRFHLESASIPSSGNWSAVTASQTVAGHDYQVILPRASTALLFRLRR